MIPRMTGQAPDDYTTAKLTYAISPTAGERAYRVRGNHDSSLGPYGTRNYGSEERIVSVENLRGKEHTVSLDTTGFQFYKEKSKLIPKAFADENTIRSEYYPESIELIKKFTGASRVEIFDHTIRRRQPGTSDAPDNRQPNTEVHVDQTPSASIARVHRHMSAEEVPMLLQKRFQIINLWRPIENAALDWPLTLCDYRTVNPNDLLKIALLFPHREGETFGVKYNESHKWMYLRGMTPEEFVLIKCFDSIQDNSVAVFTPHTAFQDPTTPERTPPRQSIEIRALVFYD